MMSEDDADTPKSFSGTNPRNAGTKRKRGGSTTSSRGVANLTPEQLERKRANDREAQRAIRERTKSQIDRLNARIRDFEQSQPFQEVQMVMREKETVQAENDEMKRRMGQIIQMLHPFLGTGVGLEDLAAVAERNATSTGSLPSMQGPPYVPAPLPDIISRGPMNSVSPVSQTSTNRQIQQYSGASVPSHVRVWPTSPQTVGSPSRNGPDDLSYAQTDERLGLEFLLENSNRVNRIPSDAVAPSPSMKSHLKLPPAHSILPRTIEGQSPLDVLLLEFLAKYQQLAADGVPISSLEGPRYPNFNILLNPNSRHQEHPLSKLLTDIVSTFPDISALPERVAVIYIMFLVMRWQVNPSKENYERLPEWMWPRPSQLLSPHPHWFDYLPWPRLRHAAVQEDPPIPFESFFISYTTTISLNWPYPPQEVLVTTSSHHSPGSVAIDEPCYVINPVFESHLLDLRNWSLGPAFAEAFPRWKNCVRIKER